MRGPRSFLSPTSPSAVRPTTLGGVEPPIAAELGTVRAACRAMGIHPSTYYRWKRQLDRHGPEILTQAPAATCRYRRSNGRRCPSHPRRDRRPGQGDPPPLAGTGVRRRLRRPADRTVGRATPEPSRPAGRGGHRGRDPHRGQGKLIAGRPRRAPAGGPSGCRPSSSMSWRHILPPRSGPATTSSPPPVGALRVPSFRAHSWVPATEAAGLRIHDLRDTAVALWIAAGATPKEVAVRGAHLGQLDPGPLWPPDDPPAGRGGPVPSSTGLDYGARQHGRKPQDARSPG